MTFYKIATILFSFSAIAMATPFSGNTGSVVVNPTGQSNIGTRGNIGKGGAGGIGDIIGSIRDNTVPVSHASAGAAYMFQNGQQLKSAINNKYAATSSNNKKLYKYKGETTTNFTVIIKPAP